jgi:hypothetical protein
LVVKWRVDFFRIDLGYKARLKQGNAERTQYKNGTSMSKKKTQPTGYICGTCGQVHAELPMDFYEKAPTPYAAIPKKERKARCKLSSDLCMIDGKRFFIRGCLEIPVVDGIRPFIWGVWTSISKKNFFRTSELWDTPGKENEPPYFGWLYTRLPLYPNTIHLRTQVHTQPGNLRPLVVLERSHHLLAVEQRSGITMKRAREIAEALLHGKTTAVERIRAALVALMENYQEKGSIVIIEEPKSLKFVQFGPGWELIMDVPFVALTKEEADRAYSFFAELGEESPNEYDAFDPKAKVVRHGATFNHDFNLDTQAAAVAAVSFFKNVYLRPLDEVVLSIRRG